MSLKMKQSIIQLSLWLSVGIIFSIIFFSGGTIQEWGDNKTKTLMIAALFLFGFGGDFIMRFVFKKRKNKIVQDERDEKISYKSTALAGITTFIYIFIVAVSLYTKYEDTGYVPVAWVWFIAYSLVVVANISGNLSSTIYYWKSEKG